MPFQYAVMEVVPHSDAPTDYLHQFNSDRVFHLTSQEVAETHEEGHFCLTNNNGDQIGAWMEIHSPRAKSIQKTLQTIKNGGAPHKDALQEELAIGDYVTLALNTAEMSVGKVLAFSSKQVRIIVYGRGYDVTSKNPSGLVKINPDIISD